jgi:hypothetical protein
LVVLMVGWGNTVFRLPEIDLIRRSTPRLRVTPVGTWRGANGHKRHKVFLGSRGGAVVAPHRFVGADSNRPADIDARHELPDVAPCVHGPIGIGPYGSVICPAFRGGHLCLRAGQARPLRVPPRLRVTPVGTWRGAIGHKRHKRHRVFWAHAERRRRAGAAESTQATHRCAGGMT